MLAAASTSLSAQDVPASQTIPAITAPTLPLKHAPKPTSADISVEDLMTRLYIFADDTMMGRDAGTEGSVKATAYLAREAERMGLLPAGENGTYFQTLPLKNKAVDPMSSFIAGGATLELGKEWGFNSTTTLTVDSAPIVFGGVLGDTSTPLTPEQVAGRLVAYTMPASQDGIGLALEGRELLPEGAKGLVILVPQPVIGLLGYVLSPGVFVDDGDSPSPRYYVMMNAVPKLFAKPITELEVGAEGAVINSTAVVSLAPSPFPARNVIAMLPGSDPVLKNQYVAVGAHSDHVGLAPKPVDHDSLLVFNRIVRPGGAEDGGKMGSPEQFVQVNADLAILRAQQPPRQDSVFNGADDDGSGSVAVQEIAEFMSKMAVKPKRSTLFVWHVGEEKGLWGSAYFTAHSTVPRDSIVAQLNMDMVGRGSQTDQTGMSADGEELRGGPDYLQLVGSRRLSTELGDLVERVNENEQFKFNFDYAMDANGHRMNIYCRSDHYEYAKWGIPVTFFTTGGHSAYHQLTDEPQYIDYPHMQRVTLLVKDVAVALGNAAKRPLVDQPLLDPRGTCKQ